MSTTIAPIPYVEVTPDDAGRDALARPLPTTLDELRRYRDADPAFAPPHWVRLRAPHDPIIGARLVAAWNTLAPLVAAGDAGDSEGQPGSARPSVGDSKHLAEAWGELALDPTNRDVQAFAAGVLDKGDAGAASERLFAAAAHGRGPRFDALFARPDAPLSAHLLRLAALRDHDGMPWSDAFAAAVGAALPTLTSDGGGWTIRFIAELRDPRARRFLEVALGKVDDARLRADIIKYLAQPPTPEAPEDDEALPTSMDKLELGALDPRKPERRLAYLGRMAELDWARTRRFASSISTDDWRLDEAVGALLNHASPDVMADDFLARGLLRAPTAPPPGRPSARELLRAGGRVVRFDTSSIDDVVDHDALAYRLAAATTNDALAGVDFLEELLPDRSLVLHAWDGKAGTHYRVPLDTRRSIIDPYGLVGLFNTLLRARGSAERGLLAAEDKGMCDVVVGPDKALRQLVDAGLLWIRSSFKW